MIHSCSHITVGPALKKALHFKIEGIKKRLPKKSWLKKENNERIGLKADDEFEQEIV